MYRNAVLTTVALLILAVVNFAQSVPPPPRPIIEAEMEEGAIKRRELELERIKRDARKPVFGSKEIGRRIRFAETKRRFERLQKRQDGIVRAYSRGKRIDYGKIRKLAGKIARDAVWLRKELFGVEDETGIEKSPEVSGTPLEVRGLIIQLDAAIGEFVKSPVFEPSNVVEKEDYKSTGKTLQRALELSLRLEASARKAN